ncbi:MAG TPA: hypothetical protein P5148_17930 [Anaerolineae bacterium]|nr:hypothetical protein [Anaerolineae bacterium]
MNDLSADYDNDVLLSEAGQPTGITMISDYLGEPDLIAVGYALEQATGARKSPELE